MNILYFPTQDKDSLSFLSVRSRFNTYSLAQYLENQYLNVQVEIMDSEKGDEILELSSEKSNFKL